MAPLAARRTAAALLLGAGVLHLGLSPSYLRDVPYLGALFVLAGLTASVVAAELWRSGDSTALVAGAVLCAALVVGLLLARTVGLPAFSEHTWGVSAPLSLMVEGGYLLTALVSLREPGLQPERTPSAVGRSTRPHFPREATARRS